MAYGKRRMKFNDQKLRFWFTITACKSPTRFLILSWIESIRSILSDEYLFPSVYAEKWRGWIVEICIEILANWSFIVIIIRRELLE